MRRSSGFKWISNNPIEFFRNTLAKIYIIFIDFRILPIMPWHNNYSLAIKLTSFTFLLTKGASWILLFSCLKRSKRILASLNRSAGSVEHLDLFVIYMFFYFGPFLIGKYDVRHYVPMIPVIIILTAIRVAKARRNRMEIKQSS